MAVIPYNPVAGGGEADAGVSLSASQTGNADSTNTMDRGTADGPAAVVVTNAAGATPTVTVNILVSIDGVNFWNAAYALAATPETVAVAAVTITAATTTTYLLRPFHPWRYLKLNYSANTNETLTATAWSR